VSEPSAPEQDDAPGAWLSLEKLSTTSTFYTLFSSDGTVPEVFGITPTLTSTSTYGPTLHHPGVVELTAQNWLSSSATNGQRRSYVKLPVT
jgi:hypothetical protein